MMKKIILFLILVTNCGNTIFSQNKIYLKDTEMGKQKVNKTDEEWKNILSDEEYRVLRQKGTEYPHTGKYNLHFENGVYNCNGCKTPLFNSDQKFETNCGWPSFDEAIDGTIKYVDDYSHNMIRTEIVCVNCGGHLGHVFNDGPTETGLRYCVNSVSIDFNKDPNKK
tara:strand:- start:1240 stop:1740 length:501 start_codon:yes stop_codon:yes gene_type:complete